MLLSAASRRKARSKDSALILEYSGIPKLIMVVSIFAMPILAIISVPTYLVPFFSGESKSPLGLFVPAVLIPLGFAGPYSGYRVLFEKILFDEIGFRQLRTFPKSERFIRWSDIHRFGYNAIFQYYWINPYAGKKFIYADGMRGLKEFNTFLAEGTNTATKPR